MAQTTTLRPHSLPGGLRAYTAKQAAATTAINIFSTAAVSPAIVSDSGNNVLIAGDIEVQGSIHAGNGANFDGAITNLTIVNGIITAAS